MKHSLAMFPLCIQAMKRQARWRSQARPSSHAGPPAARPPSAPSQDQTAVWARELTLSQEHSHSLGLGSCSCSCLHCSSPQPPSLSTRPRLQSVQAPHPPMSTTQAPAPSRLWQRLHCTGCTRTCPACEGRGPPAMATSPTLRA